MLAPRRLDARACMCVMLRLPAMLRVPRLLLVLGPRAIAALARMLRPTPAATTESARAAALESMCVRSTVNRRQKMFGSPPRDIP